MYTIWWLETLVVGLLVVAMILVREPGKRRTRWQWAGRLLLALLPALLVAGVAGVLTARAESLLFLVPYQQAAIWMALLLALGVPVLAIIHPRPLGRLAIALIGVLVLHSATYWWIDHQMRRQLRALTAEADQQADSVTPPPVPAEENAASIYMQAAELWGDPDQFTAEWNNAWLPVTEEEPEAFDLNDPELRQFLERRQPVIERMREAASRPACNFNHDYRQPFYDLDLPELDTVRPMVLILSLNALVAATDGNHQQALGDLQTALNAARHVGNEPLTVSMLVSVACDRITCHALERVLLSATFSETELAALRIDSADTYRHQLHNALVMEETTGMRVFASLVDAAELPGRSSSGSAFFVFLMPRDLLAYRTLFQWAQQLCEHPYHEVIDDWDELPIDVENGDGGLVTLTLCPALRALAGVAAAGDARRSVMRAGIAAARYQAVAGRWPNAMSELVPDYLPSLPIDPFNGQPIRHLQRDGALILYSVGRNLQDDQGVSTVDYPFDGDITFTLSPPASNRPASNGP